MIFDLTFVSHLFPTHQGMDQDGAIVDRVYTDSRETVTNGLFVPIIGDRFNGHDFILQVVEQGAVAALWQNDQPVPDDVPNDFPLFFVDDTLHALQQLAQAYRDDIDPTVIGITGSNGKTTTKELIGTSLSQFFRVTKTEGNLNNLIGMPLSILTMPRDTDVLVLEMGMNQFGEIERLSTIAKPDIAVITNIGESHIEYLGSREGIAKAKSEIVAGMPDDGFLIIDGDEPLLDSQLVRQMIRCGFESGLDYVVSNVVQHDMNTTFRVNGSDVSIPLLGRHQAKNSAYAIAAADILKVPQRDMIQTLADLTLPSMRFEHIQSSSGAVLINDAYNASATSMKASIDVVKQMAYSNKVLVLGDIFELGEHRVTEHQKVGTVIDQSISALITIGDASQHIHEGLTASFSGKAHHVQTIDEAKGILEPWLQPDTVMLFKASRGMTLETLIDALD
ncbi:UDP-N-acetylmuramoyl-tripeptide--D-alanyl-D-alanine ligase [Alkalibacillus flavidus]|uniref:UDP-N-acetylmuramoyl-tripeptide--D-alanyl-D-alanine ligase n=2 Tax=Alkalibacillus flavidus TaxID=546021 RepID=A0ABV2KR40_9BACI